MVPNDTANVSVARGVAGGYLFSAPRTSAVLAMIPALADLSWALPSAFANLGYVAADGITETESATTEVETDVDGRPVNVTRHDRTEQVRFRLVEMRGSALAESHGHVNVDATDDLLTVHHNNLQREHRVYVAELVLKDGRRWRKVIPNGQVTDVADLTLSSNELVGREVTVGCNAHAWESDGTTHVDTAIDFVSTGPTEATPTPDEGGDDPTPTPTPSGSGTALLGSLLSSVQLTPAFDAETFSYALSSSSPYVVFRAVPDDPAATVRLSVLGGSVHQLASGIDQAVYLHEGTQRVLVEVSNPDTGRTATYEISATCAEAASGDATLAAMCVSNAGLVPMFDPAVTSYSATVTTSGYNSLFAKKADPSSTLSCTLNGQQSYVSDGYSAVSWAEGTNTLEVTVTNGGDSTTYTVYVRYAPA